MRDIGTKQDMETLVSSFYRKVRQDHLLGPVFAHVDWDHHTPIIVDFWASAILGDQSYRGNPFQKHIGLSVSSQHFERWLSLFTETVDELFAGDRAEETKARAYSIAGIFQHKLGLL